ncbi:HupE/UreJ family protein [Bradyrhizobium ganzhouense]|uniref:HupE/UreJ family protein n=1 Tax=Bradyrhizobium ganzhouense TaxID=1179767 RepID=UPI003CF72666
MSGLRLAHGAELPRAANALAYGVGFVTASGFLHLFGIAIGTLTRWPAGERIARPRSRRMKLNPYGPCWR